MTKKTPKKTDWVPHSEINKLPPDRIPLVRETWESYHTAIFTLIEQNADPSALEDIRVKATAYYEAYLDLLITNRTT
jgi:hypothetical protein